MTKTIKPTNIAKPIRRSLVLWHLCDPDVQGDHAQKLYGEYFPASETAVAVSRDGVGFAALGESLEETRAWFDTLCEEEQARVDQSPDFGCENAVLTLQASNMGMDTGILERIRMGEGPRDKVFEDLLAPLRLTNQKVALALKDSHEEETYDDVKGVLHTWNRHTSREMDNKGARKMFINALEARMRAVDKVLEIVNDRTLSRMYDVVGQEAILEPSARRLRQALHAFRPETVSFQNQDPFDMLIILWANILRAEPDVKDDVEIVYLTLKAIITESALEKRFEDEDFRRRNRRERNSATFREDRAELMRLRNVKEGYNKEVLTQRIDDNMGKIMYARGELRKAVLDEVLELTVLQAAQKSALREKHTPDRTGLRNACVEADTKLESMHCHSLDDLETRCEVVSNQVQEMRSIHGKALTRAMKFAGQDLQHLDEATRKRIIEERKNEPVTERMMSETLIGLSGTRQAAKQMQEQVDLMGTSLDELLKAANTRYQEYDAMLSWINSDQSADDSSKEIKKD